MFQVQRDRDRHPQKERALLMTRSEELDAMSESDKETDLLKNIKEHGMIRIYGRGSLAFWGGALNSLVEAGTVKTELVENYDAQESYLKVELA